MGMEQLHQGHLSCPQRASQWRFDRRYVDLWLVQWSSGAALWRDLPRVTLTQPQQARMAKIADPELQRRYAWTQVWLVEVLARYVSESRATLRILKNSQGRPHLSCPGPTFSLSHCGAFVLLAVDPQGQALGVDIEPQDPKRAMQGIVSRFFGPDNQRHFSQLPAAQRCQAFYWWWTAKEALAKACGQGLSTELLALPLPVQPNSSLTVTWDRERYGLSSLGSWKGCQASLCRALRRQSAPLRSFWLSQQELA